MVILLAYYSVLWNKGFFRFAHSPLCLYLILFRFHLSVSGFFFRMYTMERMSLTLIHAIVYYKCNSNDCRDEDTSQRPGLYMMNHNGPYSLTSFLCTFHNKQCTSINFVIIHFLLILEIMTSFGPFNKVSYSFIHSVNATPINDFYWQICIILTIMWGHFLCHTWNQLNCCKRRINCQGVCFIHIY